MLECLLYAEYGSPLDMVTTLPKSFFRKQLRSPRWPYADGHVIVANQVLAYHGIASKNDDDDPAIRRGCGTVIMWSMRRHTMQTAKMTMKTKEYLDERCQVDRIVGDRWASSIDGNRCACQKLTDQCYRIRSVIIGNIN